MLWSEYSSESVVNVMVIDSNDYNGSILNANNCLKPVAAGAGIRGISLKPSFSEETLLNCFASCSLLLLPYLYLIKQ